MSVPARPVVSSHAKLRLLQRAGVNAGTVADAWQESTPVAITYREYHHAMYHHALDVVLLERSGVITTVLRAAYEEFTEAAR